MGISVQYIHHSLVLIFLSQGWGRVKKNLISCFLRVVRLFPTLEFVSHFLFSSRFVLFLIFNNKKHFFRGGGGLLKIRKISFLVVRLG